jgi:arginine deiminase
MASPSKSKSRAQPTKESALREHLEFLKSLRDQVNEEIKILESLVEATNMTSADESSRKPTNNKPAYKAKGSASAKKQAPKKSSITLLEAVNSLPIPELIDKLKSVNAKQNVIRNIINQRKRSKFEPFASHDDLIERIKGLAQSSLDNILEEWS